MGRLNRRTFAQPDLLKSIQPEILMRLLEPCLDLRKSHGLSLPQEEGAEIDALEIHGVLTKPYEWPDPHVVEGLHIIGNLGNDENFDELLDIARSNFIEVDMEATAADVAARIWIEAPQALESEEREAGFHRPRRFESFRARNREDVLPAEQLPTQFDALEADLEEWFLARKRGVGCRVIRIDLPGEVHFLVQHGDPFKRQPSRKGAQSTCTFFRPEKTDLVIYDALNNELRISASTIGELRLYREKFGKHVFGDPEKFVYTQKYTLAPLKTEGASALRCRDVGGIDWVRLTELAYAWPRAFDHTETNKANDVFKALEVKGRGIETQAELLHARFAVKLAGETNPRTVLIQPPNVGEYGWGDGVTVIEQWLRARGFVLAGSVADDEISQPFVAFA